MNEPLDPLPDDLSEALAQLTPPPSPAGAREALLEQLHRLQGVGAAAAAAAAGGAATATTAGATATAATTVPWWFAAGALVVGVGAGIGVDRLALRSEPPPPVVAKVAVAEQVVPPPETPPVAVPDLPVPVPAPQVVKAPPPPPVRPRVVEQPSEAPAADESLRAERVLIDGARAVVARDASRALSLLDEHRTRFPSGQLAEEREALSIQTLVLLRRVDDARARLLAFEQQHETSPLRAPLRRLVEESGKE